jgi:hypothetical protein
VQGRVVGARQRNRALGLAERLAHPHDRLGRHTSLLSNCRRLKASDQLAQRVEVYPRVARHPSLFDQHVEHAQRDGRLVARVGGYPLVAFGRRHGHQRADVGGPRKGQLAAALLGRAEGGVLAMELNG